LSVVLRLRPQATGCWWRVEEYQEEQAMGCCNEPVNVLAPAALDPTQHVNFSKGMVLGVDDFAQEFTYLAGRDQWLVRDAIGYGTVSGLRVFADSAGAERPRLHVSASSAFVPSGRQVCIPADQCAVVNRWLAKPDNAATVYRLLNPVSPPLSPPLSPPVVLSPPPVATGTISLYLTLCWADCTTRPVPIPGEPCRSEDELMADSRVADDFRLELRAAAPVQVEEDALRDFVRWLRTNVQVVDTSPPPAADAAAWLDALRPAAQPWLDAAAVSPPASFATLGDYLFDLSPPGLTVARERVCDFLRAAFRFWVTELRPLWMARRCHRVVHQDQHCVLLARVEFEVAWVGGSPTGVWQITGSPASMSIDETTRPFLAHQRLLQEWLLCGCECAGLGAAGAISGPTPSAPALPGLAASAARVPVLTITTDLTLDDSHYCAICRGGGSMTITLPASLPINAGRVHVVKNVDVDTLIVAADAVAGDLIDDKPSLAVKKRKAVTLIADGAGQWQVVGMA
jgi:hypothetical protein